MRIPAVIALVAAASTLGLNACAPSATSGTDVGERPERQCFDPDHLRNFRVTRSQTIYVRAANGDVFELQASGACPTDLGSTLGIAVGSASGVGRLCTGDTANVAVQGAARSASPCRARVSRVLTEEQVAALPDRDRP